MNTPDVDRSWPRRNAWIVLVILGGLQAASGLAILINPVDWARFERSTGIARSPDLAVWVEGQARLCGGMAFGVGLFAAALAWTQVRRQDLAGWRLMWIFPGVLALMTIVFAISGALPQAGAYGALTVVAIGGLLLARPSQ